MKRPLLLGLLATVLLAGAGAGVHAWRTGQQRAALAQASVPPRPDLATWSPELTQRLAACEARIRGGQDTLATLGELSRLYHANGFLAEAQQCYEGLEQLEPDNPRRLHRHATILAGYGDIEPARSRWRRARELAPDYRAVSLRLAELSIKADDFATARREYDAILAWFPDEPYAILGLARCEIQAERWSAALPLLERLVNQTSYQLGYDLLVTVYERLGRTADAERVRAMYRASGAFHDYTDPWMLELNDDCYSAYTLALASGAAELEQDYALATRRIERAIALAPAEGSLNFQYGRLLLRQKRYSAARSQFEQATRVTPGFSDGWAYLSTLLETLGDRAGAARVLADGLRACPDSPGLHLIHARNLVRDRNPEQAIAEFRTTIRLRPTEAEGYLGLATTLFQLGRQEEGLAEVDRALVAEPEHPAALSLRTFHALSNGNQPEAERWLRRLLRQPRSEARDREQFLQAYRQQFGRNFN